MPPPRPTPPAHAETLGSPLGRHSTTKSTVPPVRTDPLLETLPSDVMIPSLTVLVVASVTLTGLHMVFNVLLDHERGVTGTFRRWRRVLWMSRRAHIVEPLPAEKAHRMTQKHHTGTVRTSTTEALSPVELYDSAAFFRGIASPTSATVEDAAATVEGSAGVAVRADASRPGQCAKVGGSFAGLVPTLLAAPSYSNDTPAPAITEMAVYHEENPPATVPAPVVSEALTDTMEAVRLESQRLIFVFHPYYIVACACKTFTMLMYIQYHFGQIEGGWRRFCTCGAANLFSGLLTPVWEYVGMVLLPIDPDRTAAVVTKEEEEKADSVFIVELLFRIGALELDDLPTVLMQGSSFVAFAAVLVPLLGVFCVMGILHYVWVYVPLWLGYFAIRQLYYKGANALPSSATRNATAVVGMTAEILKALGMKALTTFVLLFTVQSSFLLGLAWTENASYDEGLRFVADWEGRLGPSTVGTLFHRVCLCSQLFL